MPYGVTSDLQNAASNLVDAYKRSELHVESGLGIFALSAIIVDKAEPSEALKSNVVWSFGLNNPKYLVSSLQLSNFRKKNKVTPESDVKGEKGAYFINSEVVLKQNSKQKWTIVANVNQDHSDVAQLINTIQSEKNIEDLINQDIEFGTQNLISLNASSDALQFTADNLRDTRHFANTLFNIMRGGIFDNNYQIEKHDFLKYIEKANVNVFQKIQNDANQLPQLFSLDEIKQFATNQNDADFKRLTFRILTFKI